MNTMRRARALQAVIYAPPGQLPLWTTACVEHCASMGYAVFGLIVGDCDGTNWNDVIDLLARGVAQIAVVARREHLPPDRLPRLEVTAEAPLVAPDRRRPRRAGMAEPTRPHVVPGN